MVFAIKGLILINVYRMNHLVMVCNCSVLVTCVAMDASLEH